MMPSYKPIYPFVVAHLLYLDQYLAGLPWNSCWDKYEINEGFVFVEAGLHLKICYYNKEIFEQ